MQLKQINMQTYSLHRPVVKQSRVSVCTTKIDVESRPFVKLLCSAIQIPLCFYTARQWWVWKYIAPGTYCTCTPLTL